MNILVKPAGENTGNLVILADNTQSISLVDVTTGEIIETGRNTGASNGRESTIRFSKPGSSYQNVGIMDDKGNILITMDDASQRLQFNYSDYDALVANPVSTIDGYRWDNSQNLAATSSGSTSNADIVNMSSEEYINYLENGATTAGETEAVSPLDPDKTGYYEQQGQVDTAGQVGGAFGTVGGAIAGSYLGSPSVGAAVGNAVGEAAAEEMAEPLVKIGRGDPKQTAKGYGAAIGTAIGYYFGGSAGALVGNKIGEAAGSGAFSAGSKVFGSDTTAHLFGGSVTKVEDEKTRNQIKQMQEAGYTDEQIMELIPGLKQMEADDSLSGFAAGRRGEARSRDEQLQDNLEGYGIDKDFVGYATDADTGETKWVNNQWLNSGDVSTLRPEDTAGYMMWAEEFGPEYWNLSEEQRLQLNQDALDKGVIKEGKGTMWFDAESPNYQSFIDSANTVFNPTATTAATELDTSSGLDTSSLEGMDTDVSGINFRSLVADDSGQIATEDSSVSDVSLMSGAEAAALAAAAEQEELYKKQMAISMIQNAPSNQLSSALLSSAFNVEEEDSRANFQQLASALQ